MAWNWGGAGTGAAGGFAAGSMLGPPGAGIGFLLGGIGGGLMGGGKKEDEFQQYTPPGYEKLMNLLYQREAGGYPELQNLWQTSWQDQIMPGIQETYRAKRGMGAASTPEIAALGQAGRGLMSDMSMRDLTARQNALQMLTGATQRPTTMYTEPDAPMWQNLLNFAAPVASSYMQGQAMKGMFDTMGGGGKQIQPRFSPYDTSGSGGGWQQNLNVDPDIQQLMALFGIGE